MMGMGMMSLHMLRNRSGARNALAGTLALACLALLSACGGGGDGAGFLSDQSSDLSYTLRLALVDGEGNPTTTVSDTLPATLGVLVRERNSAAAPVPGVVVTATASAAVIAPGNGRALTNAEGIATLQIRGGATLGADTITVTATSPAGEVSETLGVEIVSSGFRLGSFNGTTFVPGRIGLSNDSLSFRGSALLRLAVVDANGQPVTAAERSIRLSSTCSLSGAASFRAVSATTDGASTLTVQTVNGLASAEYRAGSCENRDRLTATLVEGDATASADVRIAQRDTDFIGFVNAQPADGAGISARTLIALQGTGGPGRPEEATATFEVLEQAVVLASGDPQPGTPAYLQLAGRRPLAGVAVRFSLTSDIGGITLTTPTAVSDSNGLVRVRVRAGNVAASTQIIATFDGAGRSGGNAGGGAPQSAASNQIVVGTGLPQQNGISVASERFNIARGRSTDGLQTLLTVRLVDRFGNPVANGTSVVFSTEYGAIDTSCVTGVSHGVRAQRVTRSPALPAPPVMGSCSVLWTSQNPRFPVFNRERVQTTADDGSYACAAHTGSFGPCPGDLGAIRGLRSTVTITAVGEEFFVDANGNGFYDRGERFDNLPEAFSDYNEDGVYTPFAGPQCPAPSSAENCRAAGAEEVFRDLNGDGLYSENIDPNTGRGVYNGSLCPRSGDGVFCSRDLVEVRQSIVLVLSSTVQRLSVLAARRIDRPSTATDTLQEGFTYDIHVADLYNNPPGRGTALIFTGVGDCAVDFPEPARTYTETVPDLPSKGAYTVPVRINGTGAAGGGRLSVSARGPDNMGEPDENGATRLLGTFACSTRCNDPTTDATTGETTCNETLPD